jgi:hypothetical protein
MGDFTIKIKMKAWLFTAYLLHTWCLITAYLVHGECMKFVVLLNA